MVRHWVLGVSARSGCCGCCGVMECQEILEDCLPLSTVSMYPVSSPVLFEGTS